MGLPYKTEGMAALMTLNKDIVDQAQRVGMTAEMPSSEGREDVPVGTTLAMIEQAQKVLSLVHKRMHIAQSEEFEKIVQASATTPRASGSAAKRPPIRGSREMRSLRALDDCMLVPKADSNTASHMQRPAKVRRSCCKARARRCTIRLPSTPRRSRRSATPTPTGSSPRRRPRRSRHRRSRPSSRNCRSSSCWRRRRWSRPRARRKRTRPTAHWAPPNSRPTSRQAKPSLKLKASDQMIKA